MSFITASPTQTAIPSNETEFWAMTESCFDAAHHFADQRLQTLQWIDLESLRQALGPYRFFTAQYTTDLAILIAKMAPGSLRSQLATFLDEELGHGDASDTHPLMYDRFLVSLGCDPDTLDTLTNPVTQQILSAATNRLWQEPASYGIGLRAMGAECLCQVFLTAADHYIRANTRVQKIADRIDWQFLDIHAGPADAHHREETRRQIAAIIKHDPSSIQEIARGYKDAETQWHQYWSYSLPTMAERYSHLQ